MREHAMPIRVNPVHHLKRCKLTRTSIEQICRRVTQDFPEARFSARDDIWEVYDENEDMFLKAIESRKRLESFRVEAQTREPRRRLDLTFDRGEATVTVIADEEEATWFRHFLFDIEEFVRPGSLMQRLFAVPSPGARQRPQEAIPYSRIVLTEDSPNPFVENVKAGLATNFIWLVGGIAITLFAVWLYVNFGIDINPFDAPAPPTPTPVV
jgi:hypothetical protein